MATISTPLRCVATAALLALVVSALVRADEKPAAAAADPALDTALEKAAAAKVGEKDFREALRSVADKFPLVEASTEPGKGEWQKLTLNARGKRVDAVRLRTPAGEKRDLVWAFTQPAGLHQWYIIPVDADGEGFRNFWKADAAALFGEGVPAEVTERGGIVQMLDARRLQPDKEYLIWFTFKDDQQPPAPTWVIVSFLPPGKSGSVKAASKGLGLPRAPSPEQKTAK